jgi:GDSL-like Lipase/Acylhydrolase family
MRTFQTLAFAVVLVAALGCSSSDNSAGSGGGSSGGSAGTAAGGGGTAAGGAAGQGSGGVAGSIASGGSAGVAAGGSAGAGTGGGNTAALATLGSLVVLGDSISDGGGQAPFYYDLLKQDLTQKYGNISYQHRAQGGSKTSALQGQVSGLPSTLPGPVAVCVTSGGNDMKAQLLQIVTGTDGPARAEMGQNISNALATLLAPNHFGPGVEVRVFEANIYDSSDGQGNFSAHNCNFGSGFPALATDPYFGSWNGEIATQVSAKGQWLADIHDLFYLHGFNFPPSWYASDCTHPTQVGHDQLRRYFYFKITGESLP